MRRIIVANSAGFCDGVARSVALAEEALGAGGEVWCLGELLHNRDEMQRLCSAGLKVANTPEEVPEGAAVLIRSHGVGKASYDALETRGCRIIDGTCAKVKRIHKIAQRASEAGETVVIFGAPDHPEVQGIRGWCGNSAVVQTPEELEQYLKQLPEADREKTVLVFQTTETQDHLKKSKEIQKKIYTNSKIFDTICDATQIRQSEALDLGQKCDAVVVIGGKHSANSRHLVEICAEICDTVLFVENAAELNISPLVAFDTVGITAGASVPKRIMKEVKQKMCDEIKDTAQVSETAASEPEKSFAELLEDSIKTIYNGDTVKGIVAAITPTEVTVDLGTKHSGYIPVEDFADENGTKIEDLIHVGDEVEAFLL